MIFSYIMVREVMSKTQIYREVARYFPRESTVSTPPLASQIGGGGFVILSAGTASVASNMFTFDDANGVTFGMAAGVITASVNSLTQSVQTQNMVSVNGSTGNIVFSNSNGVVFGGNNSTITASFSQSQQPMYFSAAGGSSAVSTLTFVNGGGVSFTNSNGSIRASVVTSGTSATISAANKSEIFSGIWFTNSNGVTFGLSDGTISASYTVPTNYVSVGQSSLFQHTSAMSDYLGTAYTTHTHSQYINTSVSSNFQYSSQMTDYIGTGYTTHTHTQYVFSNSNGISFGTNAGTVTASYTVPTQTAYVFSNSNNVSFGTNGSTITATATFAQSNQTVGLYALSQTTGQSSSSTVDARSLSFRGAGIVSVGLSGGEYIISATGGTGGGGAVNFSAGTTSNNLTNVVFSNSNGVSFGLNGSTITGSVPAVSSLSATGAVSISTNGSTISIGAPVQSNQNLSLYAVGNTTQNSSTVINASAFSLNGLGNISVGFSNGSIQVSQTGGGGGGLALANSQTTYSTGTAHLSAAGALTIASTTGQSYQFSVPAVSSIVAGANITVSTAGSTISIIGGAGGAVSLTETEIAFGDASDQIDSSPDLTWNDTSKLLDLKGSLIINENGGDFDTRFEGDTDSNLFFLDASTDRIGIGLNTPSVKLHINSGVDVNDPNVLTIATGSNRSATLGPGAGDHFFIRNTHATNANAGVYLQNRAGANIASITTVSTIFYNSSANRFSIQGTETIINDAGGNFDTRIEGDTDVNLIFADASVDRVGIGINSPTAKLDLNSDILRIRTSKTPSSATDTGNAGDICWDSDYIYVCIATNTWKRATLETW